MHKKLTLSIDETTVYEGLYAAWVETREPPFSIQSLQWTLPPASRSAGPPNSACNAKGAKCREEPPTDPSRASSRGSLGELRTCGTRD